MWQSAGGTFGTAPEIPDSGFFACIGAVCHWPYGLYGVGGCIAALAVLIFMVMRMGYSENGEYDRERNLLYSNKGTYGMTLSLSNVEWQVIGTDLVGDMLAPSSYQAVATYSASTSYQVATGYVTTAEYKGTVAASGVESITYTVVYTGAEIVPETPQFTEQIPSAEPVVSVPGTNAAAVGGTVLLVLLLAALAGLGVYLFLHRKNVYVYVPGDRPRDYRLIARFRVEPDKPEIEVSEEAIGPSRVIAVEIKRPLAQKLLNQIFTVNHPYGRERYMVLRDNPGDWHEFALDDPEAEEKEEPI